MAIRRAESEGLLKVSINPDDEACIERLERQFVRGNNECSQQVDEATVDAYKRLLKPSIETEFAAQSKEKADEEAIRVFTENLRQLLLAPPLGQKRVLAIDPGFRTGCKVVCLDAQGNLLHNENIYPHPPVNKTGEAASKLRKMIEAYQIEAISIGNGTASRETEDFINSQSFDRQIPVFVVSEQGASIYSASKIARDEFPGLRRNGAWGSLHRPPPDGPVGRIGEDESPIHRCRSIPARCRPDKTEKSARSDSRELREPVVGVNLNTASSHLLTYISGLGPQLAQKHCQLPGGKRSFQFAERSDESAAHGRQGFRTVCRIPPHPRSKESAGSYRRASGKLPHRRANGQRPEMHHRRVDSRQGTSPEDQYLRLHHTYRRSAHLTGHSAGTRQAGT